MSKLVVLISGTGSNLHAMCKFGLAENICAVISNNPEALGLDIATNYNIPTKIVNHKHYSTKVEFEEQLIKIIDNYSPKYIVLAGFMRILSAGFVKRYPNRIINIHPSLLPAFVGCNAQKQAFEAGVKLSGVTVHVVTSLLDNGPIIAQGVVDISLVDNYEDARLKILHLEHLIYPFILKKLIDNKVVINQNGRVLVEHELNDQAMLGIYQNAIFY